MTATLRKYYKLEQKADFNLAIISLRMRIKAVDLMLLYNDDLRLAHKLKEWFYEICQRIKLLPM